jgi:hypothetical protein
MYSVTREIHNMAINIINKDFFSTEAVIKVGRRHIDMTKDAMSVRS